MKKNVLCKYFPENLCTRGAACRFAHSISLIADRPVPPPTRLVNMDSCKVQEDSSKVQHGSSNSPASFPGDDSITVAATTESSSSRARRTEWESVRQSNNDSSSASSSSDKGPVEGRPNSKTVVFYRSASPTSDAPEFSHAVCRNFQLGRCTRGHKCMFRHEDGPILEVCRYYSSRGRCLYGARCKFLHQANRTIDGIDGGSIIPGSGQSEVLSGTVITTWDL